MSELEERLYKLENTVERLQKLTHELHPKSWTGSEGETAGSNVRIHPTCTIIGSQGRDVIIGDNVNLRRGAEIVGPVSIGSNTLFNRDVYIRANVTIGNNCNVGAFSRFISDFHEIGTSDRRAGKLSFRPIIIGDGTFVGAGSTILGGVTVGESSVISAGSVVTKDVPAHTLVGGVPAKKIRSLGK